MDHNGSECLNESDDHPFAHCLKPDSSYLESDCDQQLIIDLAFMQAVKLHTMQIIAPADGNRNKAGINLVTIMLHAVVSGYILSHKQCPCL